MNSWHQVTFSHEDLTAHKHMKLQNEFTSLYFANRAKGAALVAKHMQLNPTLYFFSPAAAEIAASLIARYSGIPCQQPSPDDLVWLVGDEEWRAGFF